MKKCIYIYYIWICSLYVPIYIADFCDIVVALCISFSTIFEKDQQNTEWVVILSRHFWFYVVSVQGRFFPKLHLGSLSIYMKYRYIMYSLYIYTYKKNLQKLKIRFFLDIGCVISSFLFFWVFLCIMHFFFTVKKQFFKRLACLFFFHCSCHLSQTK